MAQTAGVTANDVVVERIRAARKGKGWSARRLAAECQRVGGDWLSESVIRNFESRRGHKVTVDDVIAIATALNVPAIGLLPVHLDQNAQGVTLDFPNPELLEDWLRSVRVTIAGLRQLTPFFPEE